MNSDCGDPSRDSFPEYKASHDTLETSSLSIHRKGMVVTRVFVSYVASFLCASKTDTMKLRAAATAMTSWAT